MQMMAMKITESSYEIAAACLPLDICVRAKEDMLGRYVVVHIPAVECPDGRTAVLTLNNDLLTEERFDSLYLFSGMASSGEFQPIEFKKDADRPKQPPVSYRRYGPPSRVAYRSSEE